MDDYSYNHFYLLNIYVLYSVLKIFGSNFVLPVQTVILSYYLLFINVLAFILYGVDKRKAIRNEYRIREGVLLWMARLGGGIGSWLGIKTFRHKTKHTKFRIVVPLWIVIWVAAIVWYLYAISTMPQSNNWFSAF